MRGSIDQFQYFFQGFSIECFEVSRMISGLLGTSYWLPAPDKFLSSPELAEHHCIRSVSICYRKNSDVTTL